VHAATAATPVTGLDDRLVVITGASRGIGRAIAERLAERGSRVVLAGRNLEAAEAVAKGIRQRGGAAEAVACDVTDEASVAALVERTAAWGGALDVLINNAGLVLLRPHEQISLAEWRQVLDTNLTGAWLCTKHASPWLRRSHCGRVINMASVSGVVGMAGRSLYGSSKAGLIHLTRVLALEFVADKVTVNAIAPGTIDTEMSRDVFRQLPELRDKLLASIPAGRQGQLDEIVAAALFLLSAEAAYMTGQVLCIDGGMSVTGGHGML